MGKENILNVVISKLNELGIKHSVGNGSDISINCEFLNVGWSTGKKKITYEASAYFDESEKTVFLWEFTKEIGSGFSFGAESNSTSQSGNTLFRKVKSVQYGPDGKAYEYSLDLGTIPKTFKEAAKANGWKVKTVLKREKASYPSGYVQNVNASQSQQSNEQVPPVQQTTTMQPNTPPQKKEKKQSAFGGFMFWILWGILSISSAIMVTAEFSASRLGLVALLLIIALLTRKKLFRRFFPSLFAWLIFYFAFLVIIGYTTNDTATKDVVAKDISFTEYSDFKVESQNSEKYLNIFNESASKGDVQSVLNSIAPEKREKYRKLYETDPEKLKLWQMQSKTAK